MSFAELLSMTSCGGGDKVLSRYDLSSREALFAGFEAQHARDLLRGTDLDNDSSMKDPVRVLTNILMDETGRESLQEGVVSSADASLMVEKLLLESQDSKMLSPKEASLLEGSVSELSGPLRQWYEHVLALAKYGYAKDALVTGKARIRADFRVVPAKGSRKVSEEIRKIATGDRSSGTFGTFGASGVAGANDAGTEKSLEDLMSSVASLSIQHGVTLPDPDVDRMQTGEGRIRWCKDCLEELVSSVAVGGANGAVPSSITSPSPTAHRQASAAAAAGSIPESQSELKTALNDLQFAHVYLTRQYEDERGRYAQSLSELRLNLERAQELLSGTNEQLTTQTQQALKLESRLNETLAELTEKKALLHDQSLEMNLLKVDHIGEGRDHVSAPILRMEFKKLVQGMNDDFDKELERERTERKRLEELVKLYEKGDQSNGTADVLTPPRTT